MLGNDSVTGRPANVELGSNFDSRDTFGTKREKVFKVRVGERHCLLNVVNAALLCRGRRGERIQATFMCQVST